jgi:putative membrane-bound dehydrogenase-like protein
MLLLALLLGQDLGPQEAIRRMKPAEGFEVTLVASEPLVRQPVTITFDDRGRLWVLQYLQYPDPEGLKALQVDQYLRTVYDRVPEPPPKGPKGADRITILEDVDGDGVYEKAKDFVAGLNLASGMCLGRGGLYVAQPPYLLFYPDRDRDDAPDSDPEVLLTGFGMEDAHAFANSLQWGPDGWLYGAHGSTVTAKIRGIEFQQGIWRYHPESKAFELFAEGGGNTWGLDFNRRGEVVAGTNYGGFAMLHQVQGAYYVKGFSKHGPLHNAHTYGYFDHVPYKDFKGGHVTCGGVVYHGGAFPAEYEGRYLASNPLSNDLYVHVMERNGASYTARHGGELLVSNDPWFRAVDCLVGPDGALYVADWHDKRLNHVDPRNNWDRTNGRIYRLAPKGLRRPGRMDLAQKTGEELVELLSHRNDWYRREARRLLAERKDPAAGTLLRTKFAEPGESALQALWALAGSGSLGVDEAPRLLQHPNEDVRAWTVRLVGDRHHLPESLQESFLALARGDPSPIVRSQLACTAKRLPAAEGLALVRELVKRDEDANDPFIPLLLWWAIEDKARSDAPRVMDLLGSEAAWRTAIVRKHLVERIARRYAAEGDFARCARLLERAPGDAERDLVAAGIDKALEGRRLEAVPEPLAGFAGDPKRLRLAFRLGSPEAYARVLERIGDIRVKESERIALLDLVAQAGRPDALPALLKALGEPGSEGLHRALFNAVQGFADPSVPARLLELYPRFSGALRVRVQQILFARPASSLELLRAVDAKTIDPKDFKVEQLRLAAAHEGEELQALIRKHWGAVGKESEGQKRARMANTGVAVRRNKGDPARGREQFRKLCLPCHTLFGEGGKVGPDLTGADRKNLDYLVSNIIDPGLFIRPEYGAHKILTVDGQVLTGLVVEQGPASVTLLDVQAQRIVVGRDRIQAMKPSETSLMPEGLLDPLDDQATADFFSYLMGEGLNAKDR